MQRPPAKWAAALAALSMLASCAGFSIATVAIGMPKAPAMRTRGPSLRSGRSKKAGAVMALAGDSGSDTLQREKDEREVDALTEAGKKELEGLAQLNAEEQEQLRKKIEEVSSLFLRNKSWAPAQPWTPRPSLWHAQACARCHDTWFCGLLGRISRWL